jgi:hypothetical protein
MPSERATAQTCWPPRAAEADERALARIDAARHRHLGDRLRHARVRHLDEARGDLLARALAARARELRAIASSARIDAARAASGNGKRSGCTRPSARFASVIAARARAGAPVAERARLGARALGPDREAEAVEAAQRSAAGRDGVHAQHRRAHAHAATTVSKLRGQLAASSSDTSVDVPPMSKPTRARSPRARPRAVAPTDAAGRAREQRVRAAEALGVGEPARRLHEAQPALAAAPRAATRRAAQRAA